MLDSSRSTATAVLGGLVTFLLVMPVVADAPQSKRNTPDANTAVPRLESGEYVYLRDVREELKIDADQRQQLDEIRKEIQSASLAAFRQLTSTPPAKRQQKIAAIARQRAERNTASNRKLQAVLTAKQRRRLREIAIQLRGVQAFLTSELISALKLGKSQQSKIQQIRSRRSTEIRQLIQGRGNGVDATSKMLKKLRQLEDNLTKQAIEVLSESQQKTYRSLVGGRFDRSRLPVGGLR